MMEIRYTLLSDGSSDRALIPILNWLLQNHLNDWAIQSEWADLRRFDKSLRDKLEKRIQLSIVPVRMTEAWLLFDISALRKAASNPNGSFALQLPDIRRLEHEPNPKKVLHEILCQASGLSARRLKKFSPHDRTHRVSELINDFSPLRILPAFNALESELIDVIRKNRWESL